MLDRDSPTYLPLFLLASAGMIGGMGLLLLVGGLVVPQLRDFLGWRYGMHIGFVVIAALLTPIGLIWLLRVRRSAE